MLDDDEPHYLVIANDFFETPADVPALFAVLTGAFFGLGVGVVCARGGELSAEDGKVLGKVVAHDVAALAVAIARDGTEGVMT